MEYNKTQCVDTENGQWYIDGIPNKMAIPD